MILYTSSPCKAEQTRSSQPMPKAVKYAYKAQDTQPTARLRGFKDSNCTVFNHNVIKHDKNRFQEPRQPMPKPLTRAPAAAFSVPSHTYHVYYPRNMPYCYYSLLPSLRLSCLVANAACSRAARRVPQRWNHGRARVLSRPELRALPSLSVFVEPDSAGPVELAASWKVACSK